MPTKDLLFPIVVIAIIVFAIARQMLPQRVRRVRFVILPIIALFEAYHSLPHVFVPLGAIVECSLVMVMAFISGSIQALSVRVFVKGSQLYTQGGWLTLAAWFGLAVARTLIGFLFQGVTYFSSYSTHAWILWIGIAVTFGTRSAILYVRHPEIRGAFALEREARQARHK